MAHHYQTPTPVDRASPPRVHPNATARAMRAALWARLVALYRPLLGVTVTYLGYGAIGLLLVAGLGGHDLALLYVGAAFTLYGGGLGQTIKAHTDAPAGHAPLREGEAAHGA